MLCLENFNRLGDRYFRFQYSLQDNRYLSVVLFREEVEVTNDRFSEVLPQINSTLEWLNCNVDEIRLQVIKNLPSEANPDIFDTLWIVSFSLNFEIDSTLAIQIVYGDETGCYLGATIKDKIVCDVWLNANSF